MAVIGVTMRSRLRLIRAKAAKARFLVLVPAHNEGSGLLPTLASLRASEYPQQLFSIVVIADNCTDDTAASALEAGAKVWSREDPDHRGKGQALAWAFTQHDLSSFDAVVVIDADTQAEAGLLGRFNDALQSPEDLHIPVAYQARYEFVADACAQPWLQMLSMAAKAAENSFVYRSREALGLVNLMQGNGFCLPTSVLRRVPWKAGSIVEDAEYAIDLCLAGIKCCYLDDVRVTSRIAKSGRESTPQKVRWAKGMMLLVWGCVPKLLSQAVRLRSAILAEAAVMLLLTSRLTTIYFLLAGVPGLLFVQPQSRVPLGMILGATLLGQMLYGVMVLCVSSDEKRSLKNIWLLPRYVVHIAFAHLRSLGSLRSREWTRTVR